MSVTMFDFSLWVDAVQGTRAALAMHRRPDPDVDLFQWCHDVGVQALVVVPDWTTKNGVRYLSADQRTVVKAYMDAAESKHFRVIYQCEPYYRDEWWTGGPLSGKKLEEAIEYVVYLIRCAAQVAGPNRPIRVNAPDIIRVAQYPSGVHEFWREVIERVRAAGVTNTLISGTVVPMEIPGFDAIMPYTAYPYLPNAKLVIRNEDLQEGVPKRIGVEYITSRISKYVMAMDALGATIPLEVGFNRTRLHQVDGDRRFLPIIDGPHDPCWLLDGIWPISEGKPPHVTFVNEPFEGGSMARTVGGPIYDEQIRYLADMLPWELPPWWGETETGLVVPDLSMTMR